MEHEEPAAEPTAAPAATAQLPSPSPTAPPTPAEAGSRPLDMVGWAVQRIRGRREKIAAEIERNRRGEPAIPTWVLAVLSVTIIAGWAALVALS
jgi:hypothetical protein